MGMEWQRREWCPPLPFLPMLPPSRCSAARDCMVTWLYLIGDSKNDVMFVIGRSGATNHPQSCSSRTGRGCFLRKCCARTPREERKTWKKTPFWVLLRHQPPPGANPGSSQPLSPATPCRSGVSDWSRSACSRSHPDPIPDAVPDPPKFLFPSLLPSTKRSLFAFPPLFSSSPSFLFFSPPLLTFYSQTY